MVRIYNRSLDRDIPADAVYVGRNPAFGNPEWGNPFRISASTPRKNAIDRYRSYLEGNLGLLEKIHLLEGKDLVCHCMPAPCHAEIIARVANDPALRERLIEAAKARQPALRCHRP